MRPLDPTAKVDFSKFGIRFQENLAKLITLDSPFADQIGEVLDANFFEVKYLQVFTKMVYDYKEKYKVHPSLVTLAALVRSMEGENEVVEKQVRDFLIRIHSTRDVDGKEFIKDTSLDFCRKQTLKGAIIKSVDLLNKSSFDEISDIINKALILGQDNNYGYDYIRDFERRFEIKSRDPVTTGWKQFDEIMSDGLGKGELGVVISPTGTGKSHILVHLGAQALKQGKTVVHYTFELADTMIARRYDSCLTGAPLSDLNAFKDQILEDIKDIDGQLIVKEYPTKSATTMALRSHLEKLTNRDIDIGMIVVDYADLIKPKEHYNEKRHGLESIYEELRGIAQEFKCPLYTASQTNRCFCSNTKLLISRDGKSQIMKIGDVKRDDLVETHKGLKRITKVFPKETQQTYKITLKSGKTMICSANHQFPTADGSLKSINEGLSVSNNLLTRKKR